MSEPDETPPPLPPDWSGEPSPPQWPQWPDPDCAAQHQRLPRDQFGKVVDQAARALRWNPFALSAQFDPMDTCYRENLLQAMQQATGHVLPQLALALREPQLPCVLRNVAAWAYARTGMARRFRLGLTDADASNSPDKSEPFSSHRLSLISAAIASALASGDVQLQALARSLCPLFTEKPWLAGNWSCIFEFLQTLPAQSAMADTAFPAFHAARAYLTDSAQVRLKLAWLHYSGPVNVLRMVHCVAYLPGISWQIKSRELRRFMDTRQSMGRPIRPLSLRHLDWLKERELRLVVRRPELLAALSGHADNLNMLSQKASALLDLFPRVNPRLTQLRRAIDIRHWPQAAACIAELRRMDPPRRWLFVGLRWAGCDHPGSIGHVPDMLKDSYTKRLWAPMPKADADWLFERLPPGVMQNMALGLAPWLTVDQAVNGLLGRRIKSSAIKPLERQLLFNALTADHAMRIVQSRRTDLLMDHGPMWQALPLGQALVLSARAQLGEGTVLARAAKLENITPLLQAAANAQDQGQFTPNLALMLRALIKGRAAQGKDAGEPWYLPFIGLTAWQSIEHHFSEASPVLTDALQHAGQQGKIHDRAAYFKRLQVWNSEVGQTFAAQWFDTWCKLGRVQPVNAFARLPAKQAQVLLADLDQCPVLLACLANLRHPQVKAEILLAQAWREQDPQALWHLLGDPRWHYRCADHSKDLSVPPHLALSGPVQADRLALHIAFVRQDPRALKALGNLTDQAAVTKALWMVADRLRNTHPRDAAFLQTLAMLGVDTARQIATLLAKGKTGKHQSEPQNHVRGKHTTEPFGHCLDHLYRHLEIPKKDGKPRILLVPDPLLKCIQKRILQRLIAPLGAHPCATGFLPGISVADNAQVHTRQAIVAVCDIRNCFASVPARLVWNTLLKDLRQHGGHTVSTIAIRWIAQWCCAQGGLPVGASTSPALLNRVLHGVDTRLHAAASESGCRYSRYADDLCFSGGQSCIRLIGLASQTLKPLHLVLDIKKTNVFRRGRRQMVTGLCVNDGINIPRQKRRLLRAALHRWTRIREAREAGQDSAALPQPQLNGHALTDTMIRGHLAWDQFIQKKRDANRH